MLIPSQCQIIFGAGAGAAAAEARAPPSHSLICWDLHQDHGNPCSRSTRRSRFGAAKPGIPEESQGQTLSLAQPCDTSSRPRASGTPEHRGDRNDGAQHPRPIQGHQGRLAHLHSSTTTSARTADAPAFPVCGEILSQRAHVGTRGAGHLELDHGRDQRVTAMASIRIDASRAGPTALCGRGRAGGAPGGAGQSAWEATCWLQPRKDSAMVRRESRPRSGTGASRSSGHRRPRCRWRRQEQPRAYSWPRPSPND